MFNNIGGKIKALAKITCWFGIIANVIVAIVMFGIASTASWISGLFVSLGFVFLTLGPIICWVSTFVLYGFGELIYTNTELLRNNQMLLTTNNNKPNKDTIQQESTVFKDNIKTSNNPNTPIDQKRNEKLCDFCGRDSDNLFKIKMQSGEVLKVCYSCKDDIPQDSFTEIHPNIENNKNQPKLLINPLLSEYEVNSAWTNEIKQLSNEEIIDRFSDELEWDVHYRQHCFDELNARGLI